MVPNCGALRAACISCGPPTEAEQGLTGTLGRSGAAMELSPIHSGAYPELSGFPSLSAAGRIKVPGWPRNVSLGSQRSKFNPCRDPPGLSNPAPEEVERLDAGEVFRDSTPATS